VRLLPSGILRDTTHCILGQGMVVDPHVLLSEIDSLEARGRRGVAERLSVSDRAHVILPYHILIDTLRETRAARDRALGTTKKGIGPAYEDKVRRTGVRMGDLRDLPRLTELVRHSLEAWAPTIEALGGDVPDAEGVVATLAPLVERIVPMLADTSKILDDALRAKKSVLLEGAQGTLLDIDHGTYPYVTSSSPVSGGAPAGVGIGPNRIDTVIGITKAYTTRVGSGPFPTELLDETGKHLSDVGAEFGSVTGRPRRTGWLDVPALRYAIRVNGIDALALTKLDVLTGLDTLKMCVAYDTPSGRTEDFPIDMLEPAGRVTPVFHELEGWTQPINQVRVLDELPGAARAYLRFLEQATGVPVFLLSVGPNRRETVVLQNPFTGRAGAP
jgi:adenylosuccinate synthase